MSDDSNADWQVALATLGGVAVGVLVGYLLARSDSQEKANVATDAVDPDSVPRTDTDRLRDRIDDVLGNKAVDGAGGGAEG